MRFLILGGGCYGTFYARQLLRARDAGALSDPEVWVVDRQPRPRARDTVGPDPALRFVASDWDAFLDEHLSELPDSSEDRIVPSPFTPHLALGWLLRKLRERPGDGAAWELQPFPALPGTPFQQQSRGGPLLVSHADWVCPVHCVEPATCPATKGPRHWDLDRTVRRFADTLAGTGAPVDQVHLFHCHHVTHGVGAYPAAEVPAALRQIVGLAREARGVRILVGTVSHCHGALHLLARSVGPR